MHPTSLSGPVVDQAALHGRLTRIRDLNLTLVYLNPEQREREPRPARQTAAD